MALSKSSVTNGCEVGLWSWICTLLFLRPLGCFPLFSGLLSLFHVNPTSQLTPSAKIRLSKAQAPLILLQFPCIGYRILLYSPSTFHVFPNEKACTYFDEGQSLRSLRHDWFFPALRFEILRMARKYSSCRCRNAAIDTWVFSSYLRMTQGICVLKLKNQKRDFEGSACAPFSSINLFKRHLGINTSSIWT